MDDARAAIIACYLAMEGSLASAGAAQDRCGDARRTADQGGDGGLIRGRAAAALTRPVLRGQVFHPPAAPDGQGRAHGGAGRHIGRAGNRPALYPAASQCEPRPPRATSDRQRAPHERRPGGSGGRLAACLPELAICAILVSSPALPSTRTPAPAPPSWRWPAGLVVSHRVAALARADCGRAADRAVVLARRGPHQLPRLLAQARHRARRDCVDGQLRRRAAADAAASAGRQAGRAARHQPVRRPGGGTRGSCCPDRATTRSGTGWTRRGRPRQISGGPASRRAPSPPFSTDWSDCDRTDVDRRPDRGAQHGRTRRDRAGGGRPPPEPGTGADRHPGRRATCCWRTCRDSARR